MYAKLAAVLHSTRDSLKDACYVMGLPSEEVEIDKLSVKQCANCGVWEVPKRMRGDVCIFCDDMDTLRF